MSTWELSGSWTYRRFNPTLADQTAPQRERELIRAEAVLNLQTIPDEPGSPVVSGTIEWQGGGLDLRGKLGEGGHNPRRFYIVGTGRMHSSTDGWEYIYEGLLMPRWEQGVDQRPYLVGSVYRSKPHNGRGESQWESPAGEVFSFIAVKQQPEPFTWELSGSWAYRSFLNNATYPYLTAAPTAHGLVFEEAVLKLETPTTTTLRGAIEWDTQPGPGKFLDVQGEVALTTAGFPSIFPSSFQIRGIGRAGTGTAGWESRYQGLLTRAWSGQWAPDQRPALVGSAIRVSPPPGGGVAPFIAVKQLPMTLNSPAFQQNGHIPSYYTFDGYDVSPPLAWEFVPNGAQSLVLIMDDPDAPGGVWVHWVVYNIPPATKSLSENAGRAGLPQGALHGLNDFASQDPRDPRAKGYGGPNPPSGRHRYFHKLYALDITLNLRDATKSQIEQAMRDHVLANAELIGTYQKGDR